MLPCKCLQVLACTLMTDIYCPWKSHVELWYGGTQSLTQHSAVENASLSRSTVSVVACFSLIFHSYSEKDFIIWHMISHSLQCTDDQHNHRLIVLLYCICKYVRAELYQEVFLNGRRGTTLRLPCYHDYSTLS